MKLRSKLVTRMVAVIMAFVMAAVSLTACSPKDKKAEPAEQGAEKTEEEAVSAVPVDSDVRYINVPGEDAEIAQEIRLSIDGVEIDGTLTESDVTLKDSFEGMKVDRLSNDKDAVTLTVSGTPGFDPDKVSTGNYGTVEMAGKYFGEERPVAKKIRVVQLGEDAAVEGGYFYPLFDSIVEKNGVSELTITLCARSADFAEGFGEGDIILENDFEGGKITRLEKKNKKKDDAYEMVLEVPAKKDSERSAGYIGGITLKENSLVDRNGKNNAEPVSASRSYSDESLGRDITKDDIDTTTGIVGAMKSVADTDEATFFGTLGTAASVASATYMALGWFGLYPSNAQRHAAIMSQLNDINDKVTLLNTKMDEMNTVIQKQTDILYEIEKDQKENALDAFGKSMTKMTSAIEDIEYAVSEKNQEKINDLLEEYADVEVSDSKEMARKLEDLAEQIGDMRASASDRISEKVNIVESNFRDVVSSLNKSGSNPVNRYIQLCSLVDNFSTTSLKEKQLYALQIDTNITKAIGILNFFKGFSANKTNRNLYDGVYMPDVNSGVTKNGMPFCYLLDKFVKLSLSDGFWTSIGEDQDVSHASHKPMSREDGRRFAERMHGRTLWDELILAGFPESMLKQKTGVGSRTGAYEKDQIAEGIGFIFISGKKYSTFWDEFSYKYCFNVVRMDEWLPSDMITDAGRKYSWMNKYVMFSSGYSRVESGACHAGSNFDSPKTAEGRILGAYGLMFKEKEYVDFPTAQAFLHRVDGSQKKQTSQWRYEVCYPFLYFEGV